MITREPYRPYEGKYGRITGFIGPADTDHGHSVCGTCGKDMPHCWDTVCAGCGMTFCYDHSFIKNGNLWTCPHCFDRCDMDSFWIARNADKTNVAHYIRLMEILHPRRIGA